MSGTITMTGEEYDALHAEAEALRDQNRDLRIEAEGWFSRVNGVEAKLEELRAQHSGLSERHDVLSLALNEVAGELEAARGLLERVTTSFVAGALAQRYPKPSLLKDCNVSYSNSSRPLAEQGERQEAVAWALANSADEIGGFAPIYYTKEGAISWANGRNIFPLYTTPQPGQDVRGLVSADDVRDACANAVSVFAEETNADQCREVAEYMREVLLAQIAKQQAKGKGGKHE